VDIKEQSGLQLWPFGKPLDFVKVGLFGLGVQLLTS
jgi:hypothetical protein